MAQSKQHKLKKRQRQSSLKARRKAEFFESLSLPGASTFNTPDFSATRVGNATSGLRRKLVDKMRSYTLITRTRLDALSARIAPIVDTGREFVLPVIQTSRIIIMRFVKFGVRSLMRILHTTVSILATIWRHHGIIFSLVKAAFSDTVRASAYVARHIAGPRQRAFYVALIATGGIASIVVANNFIASTYQQYSKDITSPAVIINKKKTGTTILDRNGVVLYDGYGAQSSANVKITDLPKYLRDATIAAEDPEFYNHGGFSWQGTARAAWVDITHGRKAEGGSTLTQQLVKNALLTSDKSFTRKAKELVLAMELENRYSKDQILEMYLNEVYYGQGSSGVEAAAQSYFKKPASTLTLSESAFIAGLPLGPSRFDPNVDQQTAIDRRNFILQRMTDLGMINAQQATVAKAEPLNAGSRDITIRAPHFVFYVLSQLRAEYGDEVVETGGITVKTTLDITKQDKAQEIVTSQVQSLVSRNVSNGGLISLEPSSGDILSMVGSVDYYRAGYGAVNVMLSERQPGSSFKPIAYLAAFIKGWNGSTLVSDTPIREPNLNGTFYEPQNYDLNFRGDVTLRRALSNSLNIPAVKVLQYVGLPATIDLAQKLGLTTLGDPSQYGLSLVLGAAEVRGLDIATVYATLANGGVYVPPRSIISVSDRNGLDITKPDERRSQRVVEAKYVAMLTSILSDNVSRTEEFGASSPLKLSRPVAAKTGTTNDFRDNWTLGYTPDVATAVWVGNNDNSAMINVDGITGAAPIWRDYMEYVFTGTPVKEFSPSSGLSQFTVCRANGGLIDAPVNGTTVYHEYSPAADGVTRRCNITPQVSNPSDSPRPQPGSEPVTILPDMLERFIR